MEGELKKEMDRCVICGDYVSEGTQVCKACQENPNRFARKRFYILCGPSASGKTTFSYCLLSKDEWCEIISRDIIRFGLIENEDSYFSKEKKVFKEFVNKIQAALNKKVDVVIADATHLNEKSRNKLLDKLDWYDYELIAVNFLTPLNVCLERNNPRRGREKVPRSVIRRQFYSFEPATKNEKYKYNDIINV